MYLPLHKMNFPPWKMNFWEGGAVGVEQLEEWRAARTYRLGEEASKHSCPLPEDADDSRPPLVDSNSLRDQYCTSESLGDQNIEGT
mmetsp:Transcript_20401/g.50942  ORF Transcript_20401/g.50942 Transcript_20401/m.50942 type:complete len:86 (+) Transcript_20401:897-1154(+)